MQTIIYTNFETPIGVVHAGAHREHIIKISLGKSSGDNFFRWFNHRYPHTSLEPSPDGYRGVLSRFMDQFNRYLTGKLTAFDVPFHIWCTDFQRLVFAEIAKIPYGATLSYGMLARNINRPSSARAVGGACNKNPIPIIIPCHRVVGSGGGLTGFGAGLEIKKLLLDIEKPNTQL